MFQSVHKGLYVLCNKGRHQTLHAAHIERIVYQTSLVPINSEARSMYFKLCQFLVQKHQQMLMWFAMGDRNVVL